MYSGPTGFSPRQVSLSNLPLLINHDAETLVSLTTVTKRYDRVYVNEAIGVKRYPSQELLYIFNADLNFNFADSALGGSITLNHTLARDRENGSAYMAYVELENIITQRVSGNEHVYNAFLTGMNVYSVPEENPYKDMPNPYITDKNPVSGYPYLPPSTYIKERPFPLSVTIETVYLPHAELATVAGKLDEKVNRLDRYLQKKAMK